MTIKLTRIEDDKYVLSMPDCTEKQAQMIQEGWRDFITKGPGGPFGPGLVILGEPVEYEDRRKPDLEYRLAVLEAAIIAHKHS